MTIQARKARRWGARCRSASIPDPRDHVAAQRPPPAPCAVGLLHAWSAACFQLGAQPAACLTPCWCLCPRATWPSGGQCPVAGLHQLRSTCILLDQPLSVAFLVHSGVRSWSLPPSWGREGRGCRILEVFGSRRLCRGQSCTRGAAAGSFPGHQSVRGGRVGGGLGWAVNLFAGCSWRLLAAC